VECIIVINKCDNNNLVDYEFPKNKIFRCSSHKILLDSLNYHKTNVVIPDNMKKEWEVIQHVKSSPYIEEYGNDTIEEIIIDKEIPGRLHERTESGIIGDWDDLILFIKRLQHMLRLRADQIVKNYIYDDQ
jgi:hypothetical protein